MTDFKLGIKLCTTILLLIWLAVPGYAKKHQEKSEPAAAKPSTPIKLQIIAEQLTIQGKTVTVYNIKQANGKVGYTGQKGEFFDAIVENTTTEPALLQWDGVIAPNGQDAAPFVTQAPLAPGESYRYTFPLIQSGTFWMHSPYKSQLQQLMAAPLIINKAEATGQNEVVMMLQDVVLGDSKTAYLQLRKKFLAQQVQIKVANSEANNSTPNELQMDAYLTNRHTLADPKIDTVTPGSIVHLHVINAAANSNFYIDLRDLVGTLVSVDGEEVYPYDSHVFLVAQGQRSDITIQIPEGENYYPIYAQAENTSKLTGLILKTPNANVPKFDDQAANIAPLFDYSEEKELRAVYPLLPRAVTRSYTLNLDGNMVSYVWNINKQVWPTITPLKVKQDDRVQLVLVNKTAIAIPIHLHGHVFEVTEINGEAMRGAMRNTVLVLPYATVKIQFDADNPGVWVLEGYVPYQSYGRLATLISYEGFPLPLFNRKDTGIS